VNEPHINPSTEQVQRLLAAPDEVPVVMLNLLRYRDEASDGSGRTGREAYLEDYGAPVAPMIEALGGTVLVYADAEPTLIGPAEEEWDAMILVQYPSRAAFLAMVTSAEYQAVHANREAALADSRLIPTRSADRD
jgi:uncharacterized protein (DUF1330 family)